MALNNALGAFLEEAARKPFAWGRHDCMLLIADWVRLQTERDPAAPWRGRYRTALGAKRIINRAGGELALLESGLDLERTTDPLGGDVGLVRGLTPKGEALCGAIRLGSRWACLWQGRGVLVGPADCLAAWRV